MRDDELVMIAETLIDADITDDELMRAISAATGANDIDIRHAIASARATHLS